MLNVYSVYWGNKYTPDYVQILQRMVAKNLTVPHVFNCVTDSKETWQGVNKIAPVVDWHGWWQKLSLFEIATGPSLYFDLDVVIVGNLDYLLDSTNSKIAAAANWAKSGHGGMQSSVMAWDGSWKEPYSTFDYKAHHEQYYGDQEYITALVGNDGFEQLKGICSYKYHCRGIGNPAPTGRVVCFHGKPDPHESKEAWINEARNV